MKLFIDKLSGNSFETFWFDEGGTVNLSGQITEIVSMAGEKAREYHAALSE